VIREGARDTSSRIKLAYRIAAARPPSSQELRLLADLASKQQAVYKRDVASAKKLIEIGDSKPPAGLDASELAAWTTVTSAILNLDEVITKE
jgi:hypothetical protein